MSSIQLHDKRFVLYRPQEELQKDVKRLADQLSRDMGKMQHPLALCMLNGAFIFAADLLRHVSHQFPMEFVRFASYDGLKSSGAPRELLGLTHPIEGRDIIVVEDIVDTGCTMQALHESLRRQGANRIITATMFTKPEAFVEHFPIEYVGHPLPNKFVVGYGLDYNGLGRNLPDLYILSE